MERGVSERVWHECDRCDGTGVRFDECADDTCVCADAPDLDCPTCGGEGGVYEDGGGDE